MEQRTVMIGLSQLHKPMTIQQARKFGDRNMPNDLKKAGFKTHIFISDLEINGDLFYRINYGK